MALCIVKRYSLPPIDKREVLRYAGVRSLIEDSGELHRRLDTVISMVEPIINPRVCYRELGISECDFGTSQDIKKNLRDSHSVIFFAATLGIELDRLIFRYSVLSPVTALLLESLGNERIEALCDAFNEDMRTVKSLSGESLRPRFSAGYGDFSIEYQKKLFEILDPPTSIGLTLNDSYLMTPLKSVTALIGVEKIKELQ
jgi:hypothetical protein